MSLLVLHATELRFAVHAKGSLAGASEAATDAARAVERFERVIAGGARTFEAVASIGVVRVALPPAA